MYFANEELKELNKERVKKGSGDRTFMYGNIRPDHENLNEAKTKNPAAYNSTLWRYANRMNLWPFTGRLYNAIPIIQNDPFCMDVESAKRYEEAMNLVAGRVMKVLPRSVRLDSGNGKVSFTHIFSEMLKVTNSVKPNPEAKPKKLIPGYYGDNYISPNLVHSLYLYIGEDISGLTPGFLDMGLCIGMYQIPYCTVEKSDYKLGAKWFYMVGRRPYNALPFGNIYEVHFQIRRKELNSVLRDFAAFASSASTYTFNNLNYVKLAARDRETHNFATQFFVKALCANTAKAFSNAELDLYASCSGTGLDVVDKKREFPKAIKRENMGCLDKTMLYLNTQRYFADEIYASLSIVEDASKYERIEDAFVDHFKSLSIDYEWCCKDIDSLKPMYDLSSPEYLAPPEIDKELTQQRKEWIAQQKAARKRRRELLEQDKAKAKAWSQQQEEDQAKKVRYENYSIELFSKKTGKSIEVLSIHNTMDDAVAAAKQYSKQSSFVKDLETKDLVIVHKKCNFRDEVLESKVTKLTIRRKKKQS